MTWLETIRAVCEPRRASAHKADRTGTLNDAACRYLKTLVERVQPRVCVEIGTFIGTSAMVLASSGATVYTCDSRNDVVPWSAQIRTHARTLSTDMLREIEAAGVVVDLFLFDGRIQPDDVALIVLLSRPGTLYVFDDYAHKEKGEANVTLLSRALAGYRVVEPPTKAHRLAVMEPRA